MKWLPQSSYLALSFPNLITIFGCDDTLKIYFLNNFQIYNKILLAIVAMMYIKTPNWKFVSFDQHLS